MASPTPFGDANAGFQGGIISGSIYTTFNVPPGVEDPPHPSIVIPFARDVDFVDCGAILNKLNRRAAALGGRIALVGLGGIGKSQLAIEPAYRTRERPPETWVFWVYARNAARFEQSFRDIANSVKLAGRHDPQANIFKLVHDWLQNCQHRWLLVLDNVEDARFLIDRPFATSKTASKPLREYLHATRHRSSSSLYLATSSEI